MKYGTVQYSPDYKSETRRPLNVVFEQGMERQRLQAERARLEREVIEKAKAWSGEVISHDFDLWAEEQKLADAVRALNEFEAKQKQ